MEKNYKNEFITNSLGFHDIEREIAKPENTYRIHIYGDSMVQGKALKIEDTLSSLVERYFNSQSLNKKYEVVNMASGDDSTSNQIRTYEVIGTKFKPDLVVCYFMNNDFFDNVQSLHIKEYSPYHKIGENDKLVYIPPVPKNHDSLWERFKQSSLLYRLITNKLFESRFYNDLNVLKADILSYLKHSRNNGDSNEALNYDEMVRTTIANEAWPLTLRLVKYFKEQVEGNGSKFLLVDGSGFENNPVGKTYSNKDLEEYCFENEIDYIHVYEKYNEIFSHKDRGKYLLNDNHPTPYANREIALFFAEKLEKFLMNNNKKISMKINQ
ncbi:MAG: hypothetical protein GX654_06585 [Desulfatiglans sp.]|nr:hypothetical protein [Desulfatiglans sp.]